MACSGRKNSARYSRVKGSGFTGCQPHWTKDRSPETDAGDQREWNPSRAGDVSRNRFGKRQGYAWCFALQSHHHPAIQSSWGIVYHPTQGQSTDFAWPNEPGSRWSSAFGSREKFRKKSRTIWSSSRNVIRCQSSQTWPSLEWKWLDHLDRDVSSHHRDSQTKVFSRSIFLFIQCLGRTGRWTMAKRIVHRYQGTLGGGSGQLHQRCLLWRRSD